MTDLGLVTLSNAQVAKPWLIHPAVVIIGEFVFLSSTIAWWVAIVSSAVESWLSRKTSQCVCAADFMDVQSAWCGIKRRASRP